MRPRTLGALTALLAAGALAFYLSGCNARTPIGTQPPAPQKTLPRVGVIGDDDQPSRGICERLGDGDEPFVVGVTPWPADPTLRHLLEVAIAAKGRNLAVHDLPAVECAGVPYCNQVYRGISQCADGCRQWFHISVESDGVGESFCMDFRSGDLISCPWSRWTKPSQ